MVESSEVEGGVRGGRSGGEGRRCGCEEREMRGGEGEE